MLFQVIEMTEDLEHDRSLVLCNRIIKLLWMMKIWDHEKIPRIVKLKSRVGRNGIGIAFALKDSYSFTSFELFAEEGNSKFLHRKLKSDLVDYVVKVHKLNPKFPFKVDSITRLNMLLDIYGL